MDDRTPRHGARLATTLLNGLGALGLIAYGWLCLHFDTFYLPKRHGSDRSLHGLGSKLMVGALTCVAILLLLSAARAYLKPRHRTWCEKVWWPIAYVALAFFGAALCADCFGK